MKKSKKLDPFPIDAFESFLANNLAVNFERKSTTHCPIGSWLGQVVQEIKVNHSMVTLNGKRRRMPELLERFVQDVDDNEGMISGREALRILHRNMDELAKLRV